MSAIDDNKTFLTSVVGASKVDFENHVYGLWVSVFENLNHSTNGYSYPTPIINDLLTVDYAITGKTFSVFNTDGRSPDVKFFITSGVKGSAFYETNDIAADISDSYMSGYSPSIIMPDMDFAGKIYRKQQITGQTPSLIGSYDILNISGEDWVNTNITVNAGNLDIEYAYSDSNYSGYSNEVETKYKFLYDNSDYSINQELSIFEIPIQVEVGTNLRYRISRKSDPLGEYFTPQLNSDGKMVIDYSNYKDEVVEAVDSSVSYNFENIYSVTLDEDSLGLGKSQDRNLNLSYGINDSFIENLKVSKSKNSEGKNIFNFSIDPASDFSGIYKLNFSFDRYKTTSKTNVEGYVLTGIKTGNSKEVINLSVGSNVYPRNIQSNDYDSKQLLELANEADASLYEGLLNSDELITSNAEVSDEQEFHQFIEDFAGFTTDPLTAPAQDSSIVLEKVDLPLLTLPKDQVPKDYYSNYLNSGESYIGVPFSQYSLEPNYDILHFGNQVGFIGYFINSNATRTVENPSAGGIFINKKEACLGENPKTELTENKITFLSGKSIRGAKTSSGEFKKQDYTDQASWYNAINYFYTKNQLYSCDIFPENSKESNETAFSEGLGKAYEVAGEGQGAFLNKKARVFVEREIYVEPYFQDQASLLTNVITNNITSSSFTDLSSETKEKLYAVQVFGGDFARGKKDYFYEAEDYEEVLNFKKFIPYKDKGGTQKVFYSDFSQGKAVHSSEEILGIDGKAYRVEYVIGTQFTQAKLALTASQIVQTKQPYNDSEITQITNKNTNLYSYHLYGYNSTSDELTFIKSNVYEGYSITGINFTNVCVVRFNKKEISSQISEFTSTNRGGSTNAISTNVLDSNDVEYDITDLFFNIQVYDYSVEVKNSTTSWFTNKLNPYNNDLFGKDEEVAQQTFEQTQDGQVVKFFEETTSDTTKELGVQLSNYPNGPASSKNYEGIKVTQGNLPGFTNGVLKNNLVLVEEGDSTVRTSFSSNLVLNLKGTNGVIKEKQITEQNAAFNEIVRLKISRVRYNFYTKDLVILGDAGFPERVGFLNLGWAYKLQYKHKDSSTWTELDNSSSLSNSNIQTTTEFPNPFIAKSNEIEAISYFSNKNNCYLPTVAFKNNIPRYLNDADYIFRILKYEKLNAETDSVNIVRKTNFLPIKASWSTNASAEYYNIYQVDTGNNLTLLDSVEGTNYNVLPNVKQDYVNSGVADFPVNGQGYYDILVSGVVPSEKTNSSTLSNFFDSNRIGDDIDGQQPDVNVVQNNTYTNEYVQTSNVSYEPLIDFNNPEGKTGQYTLDSKYDDYYFVAYDSNVTLNNLTDDFKCFILNTGAANNSITVGNSTVSISSNKGFYMDSTSVTGEYSLSSLPSNQTELSNGDFLKVSSNVTVSAASSSSFLATIINESNSQIAITYGSNSINLAANKTAKISFSTSSLSASIVYDNQVIQTENIQSDNDLVNLSYQELSLTRSVTEMAVYNASNSNLEVNNSLNLASNSFNLVSWDGTNSPTTSVKNHFDTIRIYLDNSSQEIENYLLVDDTEIIVSNFSSAGSNATKDYFFVKNSSRNIYVKVINGNQEEILSRSEAFKLTVVRAGGVISYKVVYATDGFGLALSDNKEQIIVLKDSDTRISFENIERNLKTGAFLYLVNKSNQQLGITNSFGNNVSIGINSVFKFYLNKESSALEHLNISEESNSHLYFDLASGDMTSAINLINLRACNTEILVPPVENFALGDSYLFLKNTNGFNQIDENDFIENNLYETVTNNQSKLENYRAFKLYKADSSDTKGTIHPIEVENFESNPVFSNYLNKEYNVVYIDDSNLDKVTIPDRFERYNKNSGKIITETEKSLRVFSFNELDSYDLEKDHSFDYKFDLGNSPDGAFFAFTAESPTVVFNSASQNFTQKTLSLLRANQYYVNFAYSSVRVGTTYLFKNRILKQNPDFYAVYNDEEFFIALSKLGGEDNHKDGSNYFYDINVDCDVNYIVLPQTLFQATDGYVINNISSKPIEVKSIDSNSVVSTILPSEKKRFTYSSGWSVASSTLSTTKAPLQIKLANQYLELDSNHPFLSTFENNRTIAGDAIKDSFIYNSNLNINGTSFSFYDNDSESVTISTASTIVCMGRKGPDVSDKNIINNFYLYCPVSKKDRWSASIVKNGEYYIDENIDNFYKLKREKVDMLSFFSVNPNSFNISLVGDTLLIPFYRDLVSFYLPNLAIELTVGSTTQTVAAWLANKKIVFVNCVDTSSSSPNKVYYGNTSKAELSDLNDVAIFSISGNNWVKQTSNVAQVQNYNPALRSLIGVKYNSSSPDLSGKNEFVNLPNIDGFDISIDSFSDKTFRDIYVYNSCGRTLNIRTRDLPEGDNLIYNQLRGEWLSAIQTEASAFIKLKYDGQGSDYIAESLAYQPTASKFAIVESLDNDSEVEIGSVAVERGYLYRKEEEGWVNESYGEIDDEKLQTGLLDLNKLATYDSNYRLFIYGVSTVNTTNEEVVDKYDLKVIAPEEGKPFYIFNKNNENMFLYISRGGNDLELELPPSRMIKLQGDEVEFTEIHSEGLFYISSRNSEKNFIQNENSKIVFDLLKKYIISEGSSLDEEFENNLITIDSDSNCDVDIYESLFDINQTAFLKAKSVNTFNDSTLNYLSGTIFKQNTLKISTAGHYLLTDENINLEVTAPSSGYIYLVNNTAKNISYRSSSTQTEKVVYRNTVLVVSSNSETYLKKAKSKDEFYSVLNTKALINTSEEVAESKDLLSPSEFIPIRKNNADVQSYIKLISRSGQKSKINLSLEEYYYGKDIPSDTFSNVVAYEIGLGHETIHKFLFFDPSTNFYTLPGIEEGKTYRVYVTNAFFGKTEGIAEGKIKYMGKEYTNGKTFTGDKSSWYEVNIPEFVQLSKIVEEIPSGSNFSPILENEDGIDDIALTNGESESAELILLKEEALKTLPSKLSIKTNSNATLCWIPENEEAFWLESDYTKNMWEVQSIEDDTSNVSISVNDNGQTHELYFKKCKLQKQDLRSPIYNYFDVKQSAFQDKVLLSNNITTDVTIGFDYNLTPGQKANLKASLKADYEKQDNIISDGSDFTFMSIFEEDLIIEDTEENEIYKNSKFEINISLEKLNTNPKINIEDFSLNQTVKTLNNEI